MATLTYYYCSKCGYGRSYGGKCPHCGTTLQPEQEQEQD